MWYEILEEHLANITRTVLSLLSKISSIYYQSQMSLLKSKTSIEEIPTLLRTDKVKNEG